jgi:hypothetical protein
MIGPMVALTLKYVLVQNKTKKTAKSLEKDMVGRDTRRESD